MKKYKLTKANITKTLDSHAVIFSKDYENKNVIVISKVYVSNNVIPNIYINEKVYSPSYLPFDELKEEGFETFSL